MYKSIVFDRKSSKETADYQPEPKGKQKCNRCTMYLPPMGCSSVAGKISPQGWCKYWEAE